MRAGLGDGTRVTEVAVDGSNDDPNSFCNFPRIDSFADVPVATDLLQCPLFCFTNLTSQMPAGKNKTKESTRRTISRGLRKVLATCSTARAAGGGQRNRPL